MDSRVIQRHPLQHAGTSQTERRLAALDPGSAPIDERSPEDLIRFCDGFATHIKLPSLDGRELSWQGFFELFRGRTESEVRAEAAERPHAALFLAFLHLFRHAQNDLNDLTRRHLEHYYRDILGLARNPPRPDSVHLLMQAAKGPTEVRLPADTALKTGNGLRYLTRDEIFVDRAAVARMHSLFLDPKPPHYLRHALQADSADGMGAKLPKERPFWHGFGHTELPRMELGFALASPVLLLREGKRTVTVELQLQVPGSPSPPSAAYLRQALSAQLSGEKGWLGPYDLSNLHLDSSATPVRLTFDILLGADEDPVTFYDPTKLEGGFDTLAPVMKVMLKAEGSANPYHWLKSTVLKSAKIKVHVEDMQDLVVENDLGRMDPSKPFLPFGPQPKKGSSLYLGSDETFSKNLTRFKLHLKWADLPDTDLGRHYKAYQSGKLNSKYPQLTAANLTSPVVSGNGYFTANLALTQRGASATEASVELFDAGDAGAPVALDSDPGQAKPGIGYKRLEKTYGRAARQAKVLYPHSVLRLTQPVTPVLQPLTFITANLIASQFQLPLFKQLTSIGDMERIGYVRLSLEKDFLHQRFPFYYAATLGDKRSTITPKPPYTPTLESLRLEYWAETSQVNPASSDAKDYQRKELRLFHITPYGQREEHGHLRAELGFSPEDGAQRLVPRFDQEGSLLIGLTGARPDTVVSLLFQVSEGTANPERSRRSIRWSTLIGNHWRALDDEEVVSDSTNGLLRSGIVRLLVRSEATLPSNWMDPSLVWLRATVDRHTDAVCLLQGVHTQAVTAELADSAKDPPHLADTLPAGSLAKLERGRAGIRQAQQPYSSFGGNPRESDLAFYNRVSERLRHKQRAIGLWDYERILLEEFPQLHRVRCLNHSAPDGLEAPGHLTLVCLPQTHGRNSFDRLQPRVDLDSISAIEDRIRVLKSRFARVHVTNPQYEAVRVELKLRLRLGLAFGSYQPILNQDLIGFLAPWTGTAATQPAFGASLHLSRLVAFIDALDYVDFIEDVRMGIADGQGGFTAVDLAEPANPRAILTSHPTHQITEATA